MQNKQTILIAIFLVVIVAVVVTWVVLSKRSKDSAETENTAREGSLGADIADKAANPLSDKLPESNPGAAVNPLEGAYQNPFGG
ncbi:MAG: hypothetical protein AAB787_02685 [Patescibacteria group bacterium]